MRGSIRGTALAAAALATAVATRITGGAPGQPGPVQGKLITAAGTAAFAILAVAATFTLSRGIRDNLTGKVGAAYASMTRLAAVTAGLLAALAVTLALLHVGAGSLLLGGTVAGLIIGVAAQQTLGNVFAGLVLIGSRPFPPGGQVVIASPVLGGELTGTVTEIGFTYTRLLTPAGDTCYLPNTTVLGAVTRRRPVTDR